MSEFLTNLDNESASHLSNVTLGDPMPTRQYTVDELKARGIVGVYGERVTRWQRPLDYMGTK